MDLTNLQNGMVKIVSVASHPAKRRIEQLGFFPGVVVYLEKLGCGFALSGKLQPKTVLSQEAAALVEAVQLSCGSQRA